MQEGSKENSLSELVRAFFVIGMRLVSVIGRSIFWSFVFGELIIV